MPKTAKTFADIIRERLPHFLTELVAMLALIFVLYLVMPITYVISYVIPALGIPTGVIIGFSALLVSLVIEARMYSDLQALSNGFAAYLAAKRKHMTRTARAKFQASVAELGKMISLLVMLVMIAPILIVIPAIGAIAILLPIAAMVIIALYGLESWETLKKELEKTFKTFTQDLSKAFEK